MDVTKRRYLAKSMLAAIDEIEALILKSHPIDCYIDRILELQIEGGLPLHFVPIRTPKRRDRMWAERQSVRPGALLPSAVSR